MLTTALFSAALFAGLGASKSIDVQVGQSGNSFSPNAITADMGDTVVFHISSTFHDVVEGDMNSPCQPLANGFYSGYPKSSGDGTTFTVTVNDTNPIFFYCSTPGHCQSGMVGAINAPATGSGSLAQYGSGAKSSSTSKTPDGSATGGILSTSSSSGSSSGSSSSAAAASASASSSASAHSSTSATSAAAASPSASKAAAANVDARALFGGVVAALGAVAAAII